MSWLCAFVIETLLVFESDRVSVFFKKSLLRQVFMFQGIFVLLFYILLFLKSYTSRVPVVRRFAVAVTDGNLLRVSVTEF